MAYNYVLTRRSGQYLRYQIPKDIKHLVGQSEIIRSLNTGEIGLAKSRALIIVGRLQLLIRTIRKGGKMARLKAEQINDLVNQYLHEELEQDEDSRIHSNCAVDIDSREFEKSILKDETGEAKKSLGINESTGPIHYLMDDLINSHDLEVEKGSREEAKLHHECSKAFILLQEIILKRNQGDYAYEVPLLASRTPTPPPVVKEEPPVVKKEPGKKVSEVIALFLKQGDTEGNWTEKTRGEIVASLNVFTEVLGDVSVKSIDRSVMAEFKQTIMQLPPNRSKAKLYRDKTIPEILEMKPERTIAVDTINKYLSRANTLLDFARIHGYTDMNPAEGMKVKQKVRRTEARPMFTPKDLQSIFDPEAYNKASSSKEYCFWSPVMALFTGARVNELAQLHLSDFQEHDGIWCININDDTEDKRLKNGASKRIVPLHPFLVDDLNIIGRVNQLKAEGEQRFFHTLNLGKNGYGPVISRWFNERYKAGLDITPGTTLHSFRHTFINNLAHNDINDHILKSLGGHAEEGTTFDTYVKRDNAERLYTALVDHLNYGIDLSHLKDSMWVVL